MSQSVEEEVFAPCRFESFDACGGLVRVGFEDIGSEASQKGKISRAVIVSISGEVFVEYDVLLPVTSILDVPMTSNDLEEIERGDAAGCDEHPFLAVGFAIDGAFGNDPRHRGETFEAMFGSKPRRGEDENRSSFLPAVAGVGGLRRGGPRAGRIEQSGDACEQLALVKLERDDIVTAALLHGLDRSPVPMDGIGRNNAAFWRHPFRQPNCCFRLAPFTRLCL